MKHETGQLKCAGVNGNMPVLVWKNKHEVLLLRNIHTLSAGHNCSAALIEKNTTGKRIQSAATCGNGEKIILLLF
jgi:hypothetical protein